MKTLIEHSARARILGRAEAYFVFIEEDEENVAALRQEVASLGELPNNLKCIIAASDYETELEDLASWLDARGNRLPPSFVFVDPFGFKLRVDLIARLLQQEKCEVLLNFMWRNVSQALANPVSAPIMDSTFGADQWRDLNNIADFDARCDTAIGRLATRLGARYCRSFKMYGRTGGIKYALVHLANHPKALQKMNEAMWAIKPDGVFRVSQRDNPEQQVIFDPEPDLTPLAVLLWRRFGNGQATVADIDDVATEFWLLRHSHQLLKDWHRCGAIRVLGADRLVFKHNPTIEFVNQPTPLIAPHS